MKYEYVNPKNETQKGCEKVKKSNLIKQTFVGDLFNN